MASAPSAMAAQWDGIALSGEFTTLNKWLELENAVLSANNMIRLLVAAVSESNQEDKHEAIAYGVYALQDPVRKTKDLFNQLHDEVRQIRLEREEIVELPDGETVKLKVVGLH
jgi:hypothetical protein